VFTGIVEELGSVVALDGALLTLGCSQVLEDVTTGASIAVNGCCLTVVEFGSDWWRADVSPETFARTSLGSLRPGDPVNLERPVRLADRLGVGQVVDAVPDLRVRTPAPLLRYVVEKGSITVDGVSLTVVDALEDGFTVAVIPHTAAVTTLGRRSPGDSVNLEVDVVAKYVERLLGGYGPTGSEGTGRRTEAEVPGGT
jgi:riboflavin synthase